MWWPIVPSSKKLTVLDATASRSAEDYPQWDNNGELTSIDMARIIDRLTHPDQSLRPGYPEPQLGAMLAFASACAEVNAAASRLIDSTCRRTAGLTKKGTSFQSGEGLRLPIHSRNC